jgi:hypothetical protein
MDLQVRQTQSPPQSCQKHDRGPYQRMLVAGQLVILTQTPCLEALVLAINGQQRQGDTAFYKREFERLYAGPAHVKLRDYLRVADLIAAGARMPEVQALLSIYE